MCKDQEVSGYANYPTFAVASWLDQERKTLESFVKGDFTNIAKVEDAIKASFERENPLGDDANVFTDLMQYALDSADWRQIAQGLVVGYFEERLFPYDKDYQFNTDKFVNLDEMFGKYDLPNTAAIGGYGQPAKILAPGVEAHIVMQYLVHNSIEFTIEEIPNEQDN